MRVNLYFELILRDFITNLKRLGNSLARSYVRRSEFEGTHRAALGADVLKPAHIVRALLVVQFAGTWKGGSLRLPLSNSNGMGTD